MKKFMPKPKTLTCSLGLVLPKYLNDRLWQMVMDVRRRNKVRITKAEVVRQMIEHCIGEYYNTPADKEKLNEI